MSEPAPEQTPDGDNDLDDGNPDVAEGPGDEPGHPLRAQDVPALLAKRIG